MMITAIISNNKTIGPTLETTLLKDSIAKRMMTKNKPLPSLSPSNNLELMIAYFPQFNKSLKKELKF